MEYLALNNGVRMPLVGFGTWTLRGETGKRCILDALETGYRLLDTAQMYENEGIGLAAPQIGVNKKIVVIDIPGDDDVQGKNQLILINPKILKREGELVESQEGCLSVPGYQDTVMRYPKVSVSYQDLEGKPQEMLDVEGLLAICLQHETDHLDGVVFVDKLSRLKQSRLQKKYSKILKDLHKGN